MSIGKGMWNKSWLLAALLMITGGYASAASFDCAKASSRIDNFICSSPKVSKLDSDLEPVYLAVLANSSDPDAIKTAQREWLKGTRNQCTDEVCFVTVYQQRIAALSAVAPKSFIEAKGNAEAEAAADKSLGAEEAAKAADDASKLEVQRIADQAAAAASAALAAKQAAADAQAKKLADEAAALAAREAQQKLYVEMAGGVAALLLAMSGVWLWKRQQSNMRIPKTVMVTKNVDTRTSATLARVIPQAPVQAKAVQPTQPEQSLVATGIVDEQPEQTLQADTASQDDRPIFCGECGKKLDEGAKNCAACGKAVFAMSSFITQQTVVDDKRELAGTTSMESKTSLNLSEKWDKQNVIGFFQKITNPVPLWVVYIINGLAWALFVLTFNHIIEFLMGMACIYAGLVAISKHDEDGAKKLILASFCDAIWMFYWAFTRPMDGISEILKMI